MHFCNICENMYYIRLSGENEDQLIYYCRKCGNEDSNIISSLENICVSQTVKTSGVSYEYIVNKYTKLDPTLPRLQDIPCPNLSCVSHAIEEGEKCEETKQSDKGEVMYMRYDDANMKFVYICSKCSTVWKSADDT
jgi:DNA-directed RNA polymerase subunit M/transcription elongation factor TFIIS